MYRKKDRHMIEKSNNNWSVLFEWKKSEYIFCRFVSSKTVYLVEKVNIWIMLIWQNFLKASEKKQCVYFFRSKGEVNLNGC